MPRASKRPVNKDIQNELQDNFSYLITSLSSSSDIQHFFETFLTDEEKIMLTKRLMLHLMIERGYDPSEVANVLGMMRETVYKHTRIYQLGDTIYHGIIAKIAGRKRIKEFWKRIENLLYPLELAVKARTNMEARAKILSGDYHR